MVNRLYNNSYIYRVGILGSYGGMNLGDEAILQSIISQLRRSLPVEITVFTQDVEDTMQRQSVERAVPILKLARDEMLPEIKRLDLLILGGGGILFDDWVKRYLKIATLAEEKGVPVMVYAVGAGPLRDPAAQGLVRDCLNQAAVVTVRERSAKQELEGVGVEKEIIITADPALLLEPELLPDDALKRECKWEDLGEKHHLVGMSVRELGPAAPDMDVEHYRTLLADAADFMVDRFDTDVLFVPMEPKTQDVQHSHAIISQMKYPQRAGVLRGTYTSGQVLSLVRHFDFAVGMRLHFLIFAALQGVPFVALPYASKVSGFIEELQIEMPPLEDVKTGQMLAYIDRSWDKRSSLQAQIDHNLPALIDRARETNKIAVELLTRSRVQERDEAKLMPAS